MVAGILALLLAKMVIAFLAIIYKLFSLHTRTRKDVQQNLGRFESILRLNSSPTNLIPPLEVGNSN